MLTTRSTTLLPESRMLRSRSIVIKILHDVINTFLVVSTHSFKSTRLSDFMHSILSIVEYEELVCNKELVVLQITI